MLRSCSRLIFASLLAAVTAVAAAPRVRADICYGADPFTNQVFRVNLDTGTISDSVPVTLAGETVIGITAITAHPTTGQVYAVVRVASSSSVRKFVLLNPVSGAATLVIDVPRFSSLAFNSAGELYAMTGQGGAPASTLHRRDPVTGMFNVVFGPLTTGADGEVIAFGPGDVLYHSSGNSTAAFSIINLPANTVTPLGTSNGEMFGMGFRASNGTMYCTNINSQLLTVNLLNGARTLVGPTQLADGTGAVDVRGLAIITDGACCSAAGVCTVTTGAACAAAGGFFTANTLCSPNPCPVPGACCNGAACTITIGPLCTGGFVGAGTSCTPPVLGGTVNACCRADFNNSGAVSVQDIFDFLASYFAGCP